MEKQRRGEGVLEPHESLGGPPDIPDAEVAIHLAGLISDDLAPKLERHGVGDKQGKQRVDAQGKHVGAPAGANYGRKLHGRALYATVRATQQPAAATRLGAAGAGGLGRGGLGVRAEIGAAEEQHEPADGAYQEAHGEGGEGEGEGGGVWHT